MVTYALLEKPLLFNKYISSAGAFQAISNDLLTKKLVKLASSKRRKHTCIFIGCGTFGCVGENTQGANIDLSGSF